MLKQPRWLSNLRPGAAAEKPPVRRTRTRAPSSDLEATEQAHPWTQLTLRRDKIVQRDRNEESEYLATPEVKIVGKKEVTANADGGRAAYAFKLNVAPDVLWRQRFARNLEQLPPGIHRSDIRAEITADTLVMLCMPSRLEAKYACVKANVARTNADYHRERRAVLERLRQEAQEHQAGDRKTSLVQRKFEQLRL